MPKADSPLQLFSSILLVFGHWCAHRRATKDIHILKHLTEISEVLFFATNHVCFSMVDCSSAQFVETKNITTRRFQFPRCKKKLANCIQGDVDDGRISKRHTLFRTSECITFQKQRRCVQVKPILNFINNLIPELIQRPLCVTI